MGYALLVALRYLRSKKTATISVGTLLAILGLSLGVMFLAVAMSVSSGFLSTFREKVLGVNAHVLVLKYSADFREYREVMQLVEKEPGVVGASPFTINPMMVSHGTRTATGVLLKGVDPETMPKVLDLPKHIVEPRDKAAQPAAIQALRRDGAKPAERPTPRVDDPLRTKSPLGDMKSALDAPRGPSSAAPSTPASSAPRLEPAPPLTPKELTPEGGYKSVLPDEDDELPDDVVPDPCRDAAEVAKMPGAILGTTLAKSLALGLGDCLQVTSPTIGYSYGSGGVAAPVAKQFRVVALFEAGFDQYDSKLVYVDLYEAQAFYNSGDSVTGVEMRIADIDKAKQTARDIDKRLANGIYHTMDWEELNHGLFTALRLQQIASSLVFGLLIVVACFTVVATLLMVVLEKKKEISVLKAMGATDGAILRIFLYQGGFIGLIGTTVGIAGAVVLCKVVVFPLDAKVYFISRLPIDVRPLEFAITAGIAMLVCLIATVLPALHAARVRPADGFREL